MLTWLPMKSRLFSHLLISSNLEKALAHSKLDTTSLQVATLYIAAGQQVHRIYRSERPAQTEHTNREEESQCWQDWRQILDGSRRSGGQGWAAAGQERGRWEWRFQMMLPFMCTYILILYGVILFQVFHETLCVAFLLYRAISTAWSRLLNLFIITSNLRDHFTSHVSRFKFVRPWQHTGNCAMKHTLL
jgi:hypothetical protein